MEKEKKRKMNSDDFMKKLMAGKKNYEKEKEGSGKRRRFAIGLVLHGRLMPFEHNDEMRLIETFHHHYYQSSSNDSGWVFVACPKNNNQWDEKCEFCDFMTEHYKTQGADGIYNSYKRKRKFKVNFFVTKVGQIDEFNLSDTDKGLWEEVIGKVVTLDLPFTLKQKIDDALNDEETGLDIFNPLEGYDFRIKVSEKKTDDGAMPDYSLSDFARKPTAITEDPVGVMKDCQDLVEAIQLLVKADKPRITGLAVKEGLVAGNGNSHTESATENSISPQKEKVEEVNTGDGEEDDLMELFNNYSDN